MSPSITCVQFQGDVYMYYGLSNFYQNHRRYVKSRDDKQLGGAEVTSEGDLNGDCDPYVGYTDENETTPIPYAPCGAIANSLFNGGSAKFICTICTCRIR